MYPMYPYEGPAFFAKFPAFRNSVAEDMALWLVRQPKVPMNSDKTRGFLVGHAPQTLHQEGPQTRGGLELEILV